MISLLVNLAANTIFAKPKVTKEVITVGILAVIAFLFFSAGLFFGLTSLSNYLVAQGLDQSLASLYISTGSILFALILAGISYIILKKSKSKREDPIDKIVNLAEAFISGFNKPSENFAEEKEAKAYIKKKAAVNNR